MSIIKAIKRLYYTLFLKYQLSHFHFINGITGLPAPLSGEKEREVLARHAAGDKKASQELIVHNLRLVVYISKKYESSGVPVEDLVSIGTIGLIKAVNTYKAEKNIKLATYASRCIDNEILMHLRKISSQRSELSIEEPLNVDWDGNELLLEDILGSEPDEVNKNIEIEDEKRVLLELVEKLGEREKEIMVLRYGLYGTQEKTQKEVADMLGISQSYISRLEKRILKKLKNELEKITI
ncbi:MAG: RNA polymerase sporulation sigma factor SigK [Clostridia bacterium]|nr:RNA polymerase sporulation sigma factor SigK [Clostridia bacterium]